MIFQHELLSLCVKIKTIFVLQNNFQVHFYNTSSLAICLDN